MKNTSKCLVLIALLAMCGCAKDESVKINNTTWAAAYGDYTLWIKFTSNKDFVEFMGDHNGNPTSVGVNNGTYSVKGNRITYVTHDSTSPFDYADLKSNGTIMELSYKSGYKRTFIKK